MWLSSTATSFSAPCDVCRADLQVPANTWSIGLRATLIEGTLRAEADVGFMTCRRGHRVVLRRAPTHPLAIVRAS